MEKDDDLLTIAEERFIENLLRGETIISSFKLAFPNDKRGATAQRRAARDLFHEARIQKRYKELNSDILEELKKQALWDKQRAVEELTSIFELNKKEVQRYEEAYLLEMQMIDKAIMLKKKEIEQPKEYLSKKRKEYLKAELEQLIFNKIKCNRRHQSNKNANEAMLNCIQQLNKIFEITDDSKNKLSLDANISFVEDLGNND